MEKNFELKLQLHGCPWGVGAKTQTRICFEDTYGEDSEDIATKTLAMPFNTNSVAASQNVTQPETITGNRNPVQPILGNIDNTGTIAVPLDLTAFGYWLKAMFGNPTTASAGTPEGYYNHVYKLGEDMPSFTLEKAFPGIGVYAKSNGCVISQFSLTIGGDGELVANLEVMGAKETIGETEMSSAPVSVPLLRVNNFQAALSIGGTAVALATEATIEINFGVDGDTYVIGGQGYRQAACPGIATVSGTLTMFFKDDTYLAMAESATETKLEFTFTSGNNKLSILLPEVQFARTSPGIDGPAGIQVELSYSAYYNDATEGTSVQVTLTNQTASYAQSE